MGAAFLGWINGTVRVGAADFTSLSDIDNHVAVVNEDEIKTFSGSRIGAVEVHTTKVQRKLVLEKPIMKKEILKNIMGMTEAVGTLDDGATASHNYSTTLAAGYDRPEVEILVSGVDDKTGKIVEIALPKAVLFNNPEVLLSKEDFTQATIEMLALGDNDDATEPIIDIRWED
jgi:hypothetical protein